jgi:tetratricopeptide (TPR) repeat protein
MRRAVLHLVWAASLFAQAPDPLQQADAEFREGHLDRAAALAQLVVTRDPNAVHAHLILGIIAAQRNDWAVSARHLQAVVRLEPDNPFGYFYLGQAKLYQQQWTAAIQHFTKALERNYPDRERLLVELATAQNEAGQPRQALATLRKGSVPAESHLAAEYYGVSGSALAGLDQPGPALEALRRAIELDDSIPQNWNLLIGILIKTEEAPRALAEAIRAQRKFPDHPDTQFLFALASYYVNESPLSGLALRNLREAEPDSPRVLLAEGLLYRKHGKVDEATEAFRRAAQRGVPDAHLLLGIVYKENGDYDAAQRELNEAERLTPRNGQVLLEFGKLLLSRGKLEEARARLEKAAEYMPDAPGLQYQLGSVYRRLGQTEKADEHFRLSKR